MLNRIKKGSLSRAALSVLPGIARAPFAEENLHETCTRRALKVLGKEIMTSSGYNSNCERFESQ